jgi:hypothetical protein
MSGGQDEAAEMIQTSGYHNLRRERIAIAAMQGLLANSESAGGASSVATWAIHQADELIKQLDTTSP